MKQNKIINTSPWDMLLFPPWVHKRISIRTIGLIPAFFLVGLFDFALSQNIIKAGIFEGEPVKVVVKLVLFLISALVLGAVDVICTMVPIAEFAMMIGRRSEKYVSNKMSVILMKSYALSHLLLIIPCAILFYSGVEWEKVNSFSPAIIKLIFSIVIVLLNILPYLQIGVIYRTINLRTRLQMFGKLILVLATYFWMQISGGAIVFVKYLLEGLIIGL